ncbi:LOW QUALITY PROTEIN: 1-phosphatidylinositol 4,5-bisphosphate phosphodiesterase gamma-1-like [Paramacrobiotus metropolitanus]|uniref:LOW QUALITY PROTEIN: 1-phosphatidylinositol 4,5-bisphosphate phosphodiesterase gamma-1-like n=1 Tax=Paramacrobiotus metropolitanus TaxID=2943436 RepID=UPI00244606AC|nr:LOW QUALITY PROTEIN: 1-phosphatidylinositol 4,5-bisphosphate phosphodiesterase gamma-1-like [Paramacrobiotus metropolitanus]
METIDDFVKILLALVEMCQRSRNLPYSIHLERWLRKECNHLSRRTCISFAELRNFLYRANYRSLSGGTLEYLFAEMDVSRRGELDFQGILAIYRHLLTVEQVFVICFGACSSNRQTVKHKEFQRFLLNEQHEAWAKQHIKVSEVMDQFLHASRRISHAGPMTFTQTEALDYLFSRQNTIWDVSYDRIYQDMDQPLTCYWINSSHNTYLTGNSLTSDSEAAAYARCLRMGCRCIELDTFDGPNNETWIYHGGTLTSRVRFYDVVECIRDHAFISSDYPVILSIEDHCSLLQQRRMAHIFRSVLGDLLLTEAIDPEERQMPSPNQLKRKIIIKHKKIRKNVETKERIPVDSPGNDHVLRRLESLDDTCYGSGIMFLQDQNSDGWTPHFFVLTATNLSFMEQPADADDGLHAKTRFSRESVTTAPYFATNSHVDQPWFHGRLRGEKAKEMILSSAHLGDGTFLIRDNTTYMGDYMLSFFNKGQVCHCRIHYKPLTVPSSTLTSSVPVTGSGCAKETNKVDIDRVLTSRRSAKYQYFLVETKTFDNLCDFVTFYMKYAIPCGEKGVVLCGYVSRTQICRDINSWQHGETVPDSCEALLTYTAQKPDELSFPKGAIITNVKKVEGEWWIGDYNGTAQRWFPSGYVRDITEVVADQQRSQYISYGRDAIFGVQQKGSFDVKDCIVQEVPEGFNGKPFVFRLTISPNGPRPDVVNLACGTAEDMENWTRVIRLGVDLLNEQRRLIHDQEAKFNCARELSDLIVYCQSTKSNVPFDQQSADVDFRCMRSFSEIQAEKWLTPGNCKAFLRYNQTCFSRIYPMGARVDSSNYDPTRLWNCGSQMVALNFQTADAPLHLNQGRFMQNGGCGYVLKPGFLHSEDYDPCEAKTLKGVVEPIVLCVTIIAGRQLLKSGKGISSPAVQVEVTGADYDCKKFRTKASDNGFRPVWNETCEFDIHNPDLALIRFVALDTNVIFSDHNLAAMGQAAFPVRCIRKGYRSVPLKNGWGEELELSTLLVRIEIKNLSESNKDFTEIHKLRQEERYLSRQIEIKEVEHLGQEVKELETKLRQIKSLLSFKSKECLSKSNDRGSTKKPLLRRLSSATSGIRRLFSPFQDESVANVTIEANATSALRTDCASE